YSIKNARIINHIYKDIYQTKQPSSQLRIRIFLYVIDKTQFFYPERDSASCFLSASGYFGAVANIDAFHN
ncbi:hypothetical protein, partial [Escherichia coli]|uniref:hypothetical protein n=1 Tax=Escherichia coli TaxID=562 RepID=UPI003EE22D73